MVEAQYSNSENWVIPIITMRVVRHVVPTASKNYESTAVEVDSYFITPEDARGGTIANRLSFLEAINRMAFG